MKKIFLFLWMVIQVCYGQMTSLQNSVPKVIPTSPNVAAMNKYGDYTVNLYHGLPEINVPIFQINVGSIRLPISLSYHASGIKVNDWGTSVGTGWILNAGGNVSRKVNGKPDEYIEGYFGNYVRWANDINSYNINDYYYLQNLDRIKYDIEPDIFSYSLPGKTSGKFIFNVKDNLKPILFPVEPIKIDFYNEGGPRYFRIVDDEGITYNYRDAESTTTNLEVGSSYCNSWQITSIITADQRDSIKFIYTNRWGTTQKDLVDVVSVDDNVINVIGSSIYGNSALGAPNLALYNDAMPTNTTFYHNIENYEKILSEIIFPNGKLVFEYSSEDRLDAFAGQRKLKSIVLYNIINNNYSLLKRVDLVQDYFTRLNQATTKRLRLDEVIFKDKNDAAVEKYSFEYNDMSLPDRLSRSRDFWGYFNNIQNESLVPRTDIPFVNGSTGTSFNITIGSSNYNGRDVDPYYSQACMLKKITYPTGGYSIFEFESNKYLDNGVAKLAGGHRIKRIINYAGLNNTIANTVTYKYGPNESGYGRANFLLDKYFFKREKNFEYYINGGLSHQLAQKKRNRQFLSNSTLDIEPFDGSPVTYSEVTEYRDNGTGDNGKTVFVFTDVGDIISNTPIPGRNFITSNHLKRGQLLEKKTFKKVGTEYQILEKKENKYDFFKEDTYLDLALVVEKILIHDVLYMSQGYTIFFNEYPDYYNGFMNDFNSFAYENIPIYTGVQKLIETSETKYSATNSNEFIKTKEQIFYDEPSYLRPTSIESVDSKNELIKTEFIYPQNKNGVSVYDDMVSRNMVSTPLERKVSNMSTGRVRDWNRVAYSYVNGDIINITAQDRYNHAINNFETSALFNSYDSKGKLLQITPSTSSSISYLYSYNNQYPIAQATNASYESIAYTSFEADGKGNWDYAGSTSWGGITGGRSYYLSSGNIERTGLNASQTYTLSYWLKNGTGNVNNGGTSLMSKNGWTLFVTNISGVSRLTISGSGQIDELRLFPKNSQMITYTYEPLVGVTSENDANNRINYYEYDAFGRLKLIRDIDGNIIKSFEYQYSNNP